MRTTELNRLRGLSDKGLGLGKELVGVLAGNDRLEAEGEGQQERATRRLSALRKESAASKRAQTAGAKGRHRVAAQTSRPRGKQKNQRIGTASDRAQQAKGQAKKIMQALTSGTGVSHARAAAKAAEERARARLLEAETWRE